MPGSLRRLRYVLGTLALRAALAPAPFPGLRLLRAGGATLGHLMWHLLARERERALDHVARAYPEAPAAWRVATVKACADHLGRLLGEVLWLWGASPEALLRRTRVDGLDHLRSSIDDGGGVVLVTAHCGNWEWMNLALGASGLGLTVAARALEDPSLDNIVHGLRSRFGGESVSRGEQAGSRLVRALKRRRVVGLLIDQDIDAPGCFVEFFGRPAWTPTGAAVLAMRLRRPVVTGFATRSDDGCYTLTFDPPLEATAGADAEAAAARLTARLTKRIEEQIRAHPSQWVWMHRRWRRQPQAGERVWRAEDRNTPGPWS